MSIENTPELQNNNGAPHSPTEEDWIGPPDSVPLDEMALEDARPLFVPDTTPPGVVARSTALPHLPLSDASPGEYLMNEYSEDAYSDEYADGATASDVTVETTPGESASLNASQVPELEPLSSGYAESSYEGGGFDDPPSNGHITAQHSDYAPDPAPAANVRDQELDLFAHLAELRTRLLRCIAAVTIGMMVMWSLRDRLLQFFAEPIVRALREHGGIPTTTSPAEGFSIYMQTVFTASLLIVLPYVLWQVWAFVEPALTHQERRYSTVLVPFSVLLFFIGSALGF
jgi:hypothetical protein